MKVLIILNMLALIARIADKLTILRTGLNSDSPKMGDDCHVTTKRASLPKVQML
jgi:hypothetical protein